MADTIQCVNWHLQFACPFRRGEAVEAFAPATAATWRLRAIDEAESRGDVFGDVVITSVMYDRDGKSPGGGFRVSEAVAPVGSLTEARETCRRCPANTLNASRGAMAGCCGWLSSDPDDEDLDAALRLAIASNGLTHRFAAEFPGTKPIWYGLWINSPLTRPQLEILQVVLRHIAGDGDQIPEFLRACEIAARHDIPLHVSLTPPGHTDFGTLTTFPHCPRCKKASGEQWKKAYSSKTRTCRACSQPYVPAETAASEEDEPAAPTLEEWLPPEEYQAVVAAWANRHASEPQSPLEKMLGRRFEVAGKLPDPVVEQSAPEKPASFFSRLRRWLGRKSGR